jgi:hypothetical protein
MTDLGIVMSLVLDAVDPRLDGDKRTDAAAAAMDMDPDHSAAMWAGLLFAFLGSIEAKRGREALDVVMYQLGLLAMEAAASPEMNDG